MAWAPGEVITADRLNLRTGGARIATTTETTDGAAGQTEIVGATVIAPVVAGRTYKVVCDSAIEGGAVDQRVVCRLRQDSVAGSQLQVRNVVILHVAGTAGNPCRLEGDYVATATENKTFVFTYDNASATNINMAAAAEFPTLFYVEYISG